MMYLRSSRGLTGAGVLSALAASLCCITPAIALIAGSSTIAANFSWIEPARPLFIGISLILLALAWFLKLKPVKTVVADCCEVKAKPPFLQSRSFLGIITFLAVVMMTFPLYADKLYPKPVVKDISTEKANNKQQTKFFIVGMTCASCEHSVNNELSKVKGVLKYETSYATGSSLVTYDKSNASEKTIIAAINKTGYKVRNSTISGDSCCDKK